ncbi:MAG: hypothetical protein WAN39_01835 [Candidatus Cybelea sp.]
MSSRLTRLFAASVFVLVFAGCSAPSVTPAGAASSAAHRQTGVEQAIYVTEYNGMIQTYSYPKGKPSGHLPKRGSMQGVCADLAGNVFIVNDAQPSSIIEYRAGGRAPVGRFDDEGYAPRACSVDPASGILAVTNRYALNYTSGTIALYVPAGANRPLLLTDPDIYEPMYCAYDAHGNLYIEGYTKDLDIAFAVLPPHSTTFTGITLNHVVGAPGGMQWDGKDLAVGDSSSNVIYRFAITGSSGAEVGATTLKGITYGQDQFWIEGSKVVATASVDRLIGIWKYPSGGRATTIIRRVRSTPWGVAVSSPETE